MAADFFRKNRDVIPEDVVICNTAKGLYMETKELLDKPILRALGRDQPYAVLSGSAGRQGPEAARHTCTRSTRMAILRRRCW